MIQRLEDGSQVITGEDVETLRLLGLRGRMGLELVGIKFPRSIFPAVRREFGIAARSRLAVLVEFCEVHGFELPACVRGMR